jgi:hypothetical protein
MVQMVLQALQARKAYKVSPDRPAAKVSKV